MEIVFLILVLASPFLISIFSWLWELFTAKKDNEILKNEIAEIRNDREKYKQEVADCKVQLQNYSDIIRDLRDNNTKFYKRIIELEKGDHSVSHITNSVAYYTDWQNKLLKELDDIKDTNNLLTKEKRSLELSYKAKLRNAEYAHQAEIKLLTQKYEHLEKLESNLTAIPYMSAIIADYETYGLEALAKSLDWGYATKRMDKVASIREIRKAAKEMAQKNLESKYQLQYLLELFPNLQDVIETDYNQLPVVKIEEVGDYDCARDWLSKEEYQSLDTIKRNQLALDRYLDSHNKTKWQIGRDYELYVGYVYSQNGYDVDYFGSYMGIEDLGRDLIAKKNGKTVIIQCKYWSSDKVIHEKHITQLYGTMASYIVENNLAKKDVSALLITNICLSDQAKKMADYLKVKYIEAFDKGEYPCIKCNIGHSEFGDEKIYHLPFDQQYDATKISKPGEFFAMTVKEAEDKGFRRAFKWFANK